MTEQTTDNATTRDSSEEHADRVAPMSRKKLRAQTLRFVAFFVVLVLAFLTSYRYAMNTEANMWYLFQVARHTSWTLGVVGEESELEPYRIPATSRSKRIELAKWRDGSDTTGALDPSDVSSERLTAWESWLHKAYSRIRAGGDIQQHGPTVYFRARKGLASRRADLQKEMTQLRRDTSGGSGARIAEIETAIGTIDAKEQSFSDNAAREEARRDVQFSFQVVPDCGAIPSISIFLAAVIAFPTLVMYRVIGALAGTLMLYGINILRLTTLAYIGAIDTSPGDKWFNFIHEYVWQGIFIIFVVAVWMIWIEFLVKVRRT